MSSYNSINGVPGAETSSAQDAASRRVEVRRVRRSRQRGRRAARHRPSQVRRRSRKRRRKRSWPGSDLDNSAYVRYLPRRGSEGSADREAHRSGAAARADKSGSASANSIRRRWCPTRRSGKDEIDSPAHRQLALRAARESIVLLRNRNNFLPLDAKHDQDDCRDRPVCRRRPDGTGYTGLYSTFVKPLDGIRKRVGPATQVLYARGSGILESTIRKPATRRLPASEAGRRVRAVRRHQRGPRTRGNRPQLHQPAAGTGSSSFAACSRRTPETGSRAPQRRSGVVAGGGSLAAHNGRMRRPSSRCSGPGKRAGTRSPTCCLATTTRADGCPTPFINPFRLPAMEEYDITKGFTYMYLDGPAPRSFGHGLSYTTFDYSNLKSRGSVPGGPLASEFRRAQQRQTAGRRSRPGYTSATSKPASSDRRNS